MVDYLLEALIIAVVLWGVSTYSPLHFDPARFFYGAAKYTHRLADYIGKKHGND